MFHFNLYTFGSLCAYNKHAKIDEVQSLNGKFKRVSIVSTILQTITRAVL